MKRIHFFVALVIIALAAAFVVYYTDKHHLPLIETTQAPQPPIADQRTLTIDRISAPPLSITVEVAQDEAELEKGLSYRPSLDEDAGMLFLFPVADTQVFWMRGMQFPLDMIFIRDGRIVDIRTNILPPAQTGGIPSVVRSRGTADAILEVNAGKADAWGLSPGMQVTIAQQ